MYADFKNYFFTCSVRINKRNWSVKCAMNLWVCLFKHNIFREVLVFMEKKEGSSSNFYFLFQYKVSGGWSWFPRGLKPRHWLQTFLVLIVITSVPFITYAVTHSVTSLYIRIFVIGVCVLLEIGCLRYV